MAHLDELIREKKHLEMVVEWMKIELVYEVVFVVSVVGVEIKLLDLELRRC